MRRSPPIPSRRPMQAGATPRLPASSQATMKLLPRSGLCRLRVPALSMFDGPRLPPLPRSLHWQCASFEQRPCFIRGQRRTEMEALRFRAGVRFEECDLLRGLDTLRDNIQRKLLRDHDDRAHDRGAVGTVREIANERLIDLEAGDREALEIAQAGIAGAEIVERYAHAHRAQFAQRA